MFYAAINWQQEQIVSTQFDDVYHDSSNGYAEKCYVFLEQNQLKQRFAALNNNDIFIIAETGFGCGLSFLACSKLWQQTVTTKAKLRFISFEKYPLSPTDMARALANFPQIDIQAKELLKQYYLPLPATQRLTLSNNITLDLIIGDIKQTIPGRQFAADAWFLDGFTPKQNPDMWDDEVISNIASHSKPNATFATFTANGEVKRLLIKHGFHVSKVPGFTKRDMLIGSKHSGHTCRHACQRSELLLTASATTAKQYKHIIIIGGGISGAATAYSLAKRGYQVTLHEKNSALATEASGNHQGILYSNIANTPQIDQPPTPIIELSNASMRYTNYLIRTLLKSGSDYAQSGIIQLAYNDRQKLRQEKMFQHDHYNHWSEDFCYPVKQQQMSDLAGVEINCSSGIHFPHGLWLSPTNFVKQLTTQTNIEIILGSRIENLHYDSKSANWVMQDQYGKLHNAEIVILCNSHAVKQFGYLQNLSFYTIRGQVTLVASDFDIGLKSVVCSNGYITPTCGTHYTIGATFKDGDHATDIRLNEHQENISRILPFIPALATSAIDINTCIGQASLRARTSNYLPLVGPVANSTSLYINALHGSRGLLFAPFCGEIIADYIDETPLPISHQLQHGLRL